MNVWRPGEKICPIKRVDGRHNQHHQPKLPNPKTTGRPTSPAFPDRYRVYQKPIKMQLSCVSTMSTRLPRSRSGSRPARLARPRCPGAHGRNRPAFVLYFSRTPTISQYHVVRGHFAENNLHLAGAQMRCSRRARKKQQKVVISRVKLRGVV